MDLEPVPANLVKWALHCDRSTWDNQGQDIAARLYALCSTFPTCPGQTLLKVAQGQLDPVYGEDEEGCEVIVGFTEWFKREEA